MKKLNLPFPSTVTKADILELTARWLIVSETVPHQHDGATQKTKTAGDVVSHRYLSEKIRVGEVSQADARKLLVVEANRQAGPPREKYLHQLGKLAFGEDREQIMEAIPAYWDAKQKG